MGLFSSKSKSTSTTNVYDQSQNFAIDFGGGELGGGSDKNMIAGGNITVDGLSEDTANALISAITQTNNTFVDGSLDLMAENNKATNTLIDGAYDLMTQSNKIAGTFVDGAYDLMTQSNKIAGTFVDGSLDLIYESGKTTNNLIDGTIDVTKQLTSSTTSLINAVLDQSNNLFNDTFKWIQETIGSSQQQTELVTSSLAQAYNSEQATNSAVKTYALYALIGFVTWVYFGSKK